MSQAIEDLKAYAKRWNLTVFEGHEECATQMDVDPDDLREITGGEEVEAIAAYPDHTVFQAPVGVQGGKLYRFGIESLGEDPGVPVFTSLEDLEPLGDPHLWL